MAMKKTNSTRICQCTQALGPGYRHQQLTLPVEQRVHSYFPQDNCVCVCHSISLCVCGCVYVCVLVPEKTTLKFCATLCCRFALAKWGVIAF